MLVNTLPHQSSAHFPSSSFHNSLIPNFAIYIAHTLLHPIYPLLPLNTVHVFHLIVVGNNIYSSYFLLYFFFKLPQNVYLLIIHNWELQLMYSGVRYLFIAPFYIVYANIFCKLVKNLTMQRKQTNVLLLFESRVRWAFF